jgi:Tol biopolymer transport system component
MYRSPIEKPSLRVGLFMGLLIGLSLLSLAACGGQNTAKGGAGQEHKNSASGDSDATNGQIAFRRWFDPDQTKSAIFTMNPDGSHVRQLTHPPEGTHDDTPVWSPDGTKVAFYRSATGYGSRIMVVNVDTGDTREVTHCGPDGGWTKEHPPPSSGHYCVGDSDPAFSPDGQSIAFRRIIGPEKASTIVEGIFVVGLDGSNPHQVTNVDRTLPESFADFGPAFSPDGKMLVFDRQRRQREPQLEGEENFYHAVFVQPIDSSGAPGDARQITPWKSNCQDHPEFSPDAKLVLFRCLPKGEDGPANLYWVHPDGTGLHPLTQAPADKQYFGSSFSPSFSEGEGWITVGHAPGYGEEDNADVFRMRIEDGEVVSSENLTKSALWDSATVWGSHPPVD